MLIGIIFDKQNLIVVIQPCLLCIGFVLLILLTSRRVGLRSHTINASINLVGYVRSGEIYIKRVNLPINGLGFHLIDINEYMNT